MDWSPDEGEAVTSVPAGLNRSFDFTVNFFNISGFFNRSFFFFYRIISFLCVASRVVNLLSKKFFKKVRGGRCCVNSWLTDGRPCVIRHDPPWVDPPARLSSSVTQMIGSPDLLAFTGPEEFDEGEEEQEVAVLPEELSVPLLPPCRPWSSSAHFHRDFVLVAEFSEQVWTSTPTEETSTTTVHWLFQNFHSWFCFKCSDSLHHFYLILVYLWMIFPFSVNFCHRFNNDFLKNVFTTFRNKIKYF